jgi:hypothetical protein
VQLISDIAAIASPYVPAGQFVQLVEPAALHVPTPQGVHSVPSAPVYPARQVQIELLTVDMVLFGHIEQVAAAADEYVFASHGLQSIEPITFLYVPAPQGVHSVPSAPVYPAWQVQFVRRRLPTADKVLVGQIEQSTAAAGE